MERRLRTKLSLLFPSDRLNLLPKRYEVGQTCLKTTDKKLHKESKEKQEDLRSSEKALVLFNILDFRFSVKSQIS